MLITLPAGIALTVVAFLLLYRLSPLNGKQSALVTALVALSAYLPVVLLDWPGADVFAIHLALFLVTAYVLGIVSAQRDVRRRDLGGKWFHWGPAIIVTFFMVIVAMDAVFVTMSLEGMPHALQRIFLPEPRGAGEARTRFPGVVPDHFYQKEQQFSQHLRDLEAQRQRGWDVRYGWLTDHPQAGDAEVLQVVVQQADGTVLQDAEIRGRFLRSANSQLDRDVALQEVSPGVYRAAITLPEPGVWRLQLTIRQGEATHELRASTTVAAPTSAASR